MIAITYMLLILIRLLIYPVFFILIYKTNLEYNLIYFYFTTITTFSL